MVVVPVALLAFVVVAVAGMVDVDRLWSDLTRPPLAPATGQVLFKGEPLRNGQLMTQPAAGRGLPASGWTDDEGRFALKTDIRGNYVEGATVGEHRVMVTAYSTIPLGGPGAPPALTPPQYASAGTSPLRITIDGDPAKNQFQLILEGEPSSQPQGARAGKGTGKKKNSTKTEASTDTKQEATGNAGESTTAKSGEESAERRDRAADGR